VLDTTEDDFVFHGSPPRLGADAGGDAVIAYSVGSKDGLDPKYETFTRDHPDDGAWSAATPVVDFTTFGSALLIDLDVNDAGAAAAILHGTAGLHVVTRAPGGAWSAPTLVAGAYNGAGSGQFEPRVDVRDGDAVTTVVWGGQAGDNQTSWRARGPAGGPWGAPEKFDEGTLLGVGFSPSGRMAAVVNHIDGPVLRSAAPDGTLDIGSAITDTLVTENWVVVTEDDTTTHLFWGHQSGGGHRLGRLILVSSRPAGVASWSYAYPVVYESGPFFHQQGIAAAVDDAHHVLALAEWADVGLSSTAAEIHASEGTPGSVAPPAVETGPVVCCGVPGSGPSSDVAVGFVDLSAEPGTYSGTAPLRLEYRWQGCATGEPSPTACKYFTLDHQLVDSRRFEQNFDSVVVTNGFAVESADVGLYVRGEVRVLNAAGEVTAYSPARRIIAAHPAVSPTPGPAGTATPSPSATGTTTEPTATASATPAGGGGPVFPDFAALLGAAAAQLFGAVDIIDLGIPAVAGMASVYGPVPLRGPGIIAAVGCAIDGSIAAALRGTSCLVRSAPVVSAKGRQVKLKVQRLEVQPGEAALLKARLTAKARKFVKRARRPKLKLAVTITRGPRTAVFTLAPRLRR
jgi:hypothetical protein